MSVGWPRRYVTAAVLGCWGLLGLAAAPATAAGEWVWPLQPRPEVVHGFDPPAQDWLPGHRGVDLAGSAGQRVLSAGAGEVTYAGTLAGIGVVVVRHGELRTTYQPVDASVDVGDAVAAGEAIGRLESVGSHCPPDVCLHWGLIRGDTYLDPLALVGAGPVRLLPLGDDGARVSAGGTPAAQAQPPPSNSTPADGPGAWPLAIGSVAGAGGIVAINRLRQRLKPAGAPADRPRVSAQS